MKVIDFVRECIANGAGTSVETATFTRILTDDDIFDLGMLLDMMENDPDRNVQEIYDTAPFNMRWWIDALNSIMEVENG